MTSIRWWRLVAGTAAGLLVVVALLLTALRIAIAYVPHNEQKLRTWIERQTHMKFEYSRLDARLRWYGPEVVLRDLRVVERDDWIARSPHQKRRHAAREIAAIEHRDDLAARIDHRSQRAQKRCARGRIG